MNTLLKLSLFLLCLIQVPAFAQTISGLVLDETKQPMIGAAVRVKGTTVGTTTNLDGKFKLENLTPGNVILELSFVGYINQTKTIKPKTHKH